MGEKSMGRNTALGLTYHLEDDLALLSLTGAEDHAFIRGNKVNGAEHLCNKT